MRTITKAYQCEFCSRTSASAGAMRSHEKSCRNNPENRALCTHCRHLTKSTGTDDLGEGKVRLTIFRCDKKGICLYHPKVLRMTCDYNRDSIMADAEKMPTETEGCGSFMEWGPTPEEEAQMFAEAQRLYGCTY